MRIIIAALFIALAAAVAPARADVAGEAARVAGACSATGGFGYRFGEPESQEVLTRVTDQTAAPFHPWKPEFTHSSRLVRTVDAVIMMPDAPTAIVVIAEAGKLLLTRGYKPADGNDNYALAPGADGGPGSQVGLLQMGDGILVECSDLALGARHRDEVLGKVVVTARPTPLSINIPPPPVPDVCGAAASREAYNTAFMGRMTLIMAYGDSSASYAERLARWRGQQLKDKGVWDAGDERVFRNRALHSPTYLQMAERSTQALMPILKALETYGEAQEGHDALGECNAAVTVDGMVRRMLADQTVTWTYVEGLYQAEATRLKVALD